MRILLVSDLHYDLRKLDWVLAEAADVDLLVVAGDVLRLGSPVPIDAQITVVLEYLARCAERTTTVACSGNHDLDSRTEAGEKVTRWIAEARDRGVCADGDSIELGGWLVTACAWWEGPETLGRLEAELDLAAERRTAGWIWAYHGPPEGPLSWTGSRHVGDPELPRLLERHQPDLVLCGHVHEAPFAPGGGWWERRGSTLLFNSGREMGHVPAHVFLDLDRGTASWRSTLGSDEVLLSDPSPVPAPQ